ncbi:MAG: putative 2-dehydropantoate 2-reductase [Verrucomicrobium sp.]|nr:putative 2-dehydropantoate 2-reductase [Verrucomicrobium sp.]
MSILSQHLPNYRIAIVGSGAVGCYYGGRLAQHGRDVHFLMRSDYDHVKRYGLRIISKQGDAHLQEVKCYRTPDEIGPCDLVIIAMKSTANEALNSLLPPLLHENTMLLTLQNGLGNEEYLAERFGTGRVLGGLCHVCINRTGPGVIEHLAQGLIAMGEYSGLPLPRTHEIAAEFKRCGIICNVEESLATARWRKLVWNIPFNGLSIVGGGLDTAAILADDSLTHLVRALMHEVIAAARKLGCEIPTSLADDMMTVTKNMGGYRTSSLIDFEEGREVEVDAIWGEPLRRAANAGAEVGRMEMLYYLLKAAVKRKSVE